MDHRRILVGLTALLVTANAVSLLAQYSDPAAREDQAIERQKILKAADQIDLLLQQNRKLQEEILKLQQQVTTLQDEKTVLQKRMDDLEKNAIKDKQALLKEVANIVASKTDAGIKTVPVKVDKPASGTKQEGYEYEVKTGDSLWAIAKAYQDAGVKVTAEDIRIVNSMGKSQDLKAGQKLFIPKN
jgi:uncharacterized protein YlxW (UPF0749 family)